MKLLRLFLCFQVIIAVALQAACKSDDDADSAPAMGEDPPATLFTEIDQTLMVHVPAGEFLMGTSAADVEIYKEIFPLRRSTAFDDERPQRTVFLDAFYIDQLEVTNTRYKTFLAETGYEPGFYLDRPPYNEPDLPAAVLDWEDAVAYADWAGKRLPTEAEWEKAARGADGRFWPWGDVFDHKKLSGNDGTGLEDGYRETAPVGRFPAGASPFGALDMAGNLWEWVADWYDPEYYLRAPNENPQGPDSGDGHVLRGGGWAESFDGTRCPNRQGGNPGSLLRGFRCAMDVPGEG